MDAAREDLLISRVVDGDATPGDWTELEISASADPRVWERIAASMRSESLLNNSLAMTLARVEDVKLARPRGVPWAALAPWAGWAAAALLLSVWISTPVRPPLTPAHEVRVDAAEKFASADELLTQYLRHGQREGTVLTDLPPQVMETRLAADGESLEVFYVRQWLERATVDQVFEVLPDSHGNPRTVPVNPTRFVSSGPH